MNEKRVQYIDLAKGIGVLLVILGHMPSVVPYGIRMWIFSFHMPLFYFAAGYFAKEYDDFSQLPDVIFKKFKRLVLHGYLLFGVAFLIGDILIYRLSLQEIMHDVTGIMLGTIDKVYWFFLSLFIVQVLFLILTLFVKNNTVRALSSAVIALIGVMLHGLDFNVYRLGSSLYAFGFYYLAYRLRHKGVLEKCYAKWYRVAIALGISILGTTLILKIMPAVLDINYNYQFDVLANYAIAFCGIYTVFYCCWKAAKYKENIVVRALSYVGMYSLFFFTITNYFPGAFGHLFKNGGIIVSLFAYIAAFAAAYALSRFYTIMGKKNY